MRLLAVLCLALCVCGSTTSLAETQFLVSRETKSQGLRGNRVLMLHCQKESPSLEDCQVSRLRNGKAEKQVKVSSIQAQSLLTLCQQKLQSYSGWKIEKRKASLQWSLDFQGHHLSGGTQAPDKMSRRRLLTLLMSLETRMNEMATP